MKDVSRVEGLDMFCCGMFDCTADGNAEGGAIGMDDELVLKSPKPPKSTLAWLLEVYLCSSGVWDEVSLLTCVRSRAFTSVW